MVTAEYARRLFSVTNNSLIFFKICLITDLFIVEWNLAEQLDILSRKYSAIEIMKGKQRDSRHKYLIVSRYVYSA